MSIKDTREKWLEKAKMSDAEKAKFKDQRLPEGREKYDLARINAFFDFLDKWPIFRELADSIQDKPNYSPTALEMPTGATVQFFYPGDDRLYVCDKGSRVTGNIRIPQSKGEVKLLLLGSGFTDNEISSAYERIAPARGTREFYIAWVKDELREWPNRFSSPDRILANINSLFDFLDKWPIVKELIEGIRTHPGYTYDDVVERSVLYVEMVGKKRALWWEAGHNTGL
jgi:hypothetical protein